MSFENFKINSQNQHAYELAKEFSLNPNGIIYLYGTPGVGKTHLAVSIIKALRPIRLSDKEINDKEQRILDAIEHLITIKDPDNKIPNYRSYFTRGSWQYRPARPLFLKSFHYIFKCSEAFTSNYSRSTYLNYLSGFDCLLLDDLGAEKFSESTRQYYYALIDEFYTSRIPLIITSTESLIQLNQKEPRIASRLAESIVININDFDHRFMSAPDKIIMQGYANA